MLTKHHTNALGGASSRLRPTRKARAIKPRAARPAKPAERAKAVEPLPLGPAGGEERRVRFRRHFVPHTPCDDRDDRDDQGEDAAGRDEGFGEVASLHAVAQLMKLHGFPN
ncbi:hypothetical protein BASA81_008849 [Batrachochytrium salamandrivorans]|nr:hypothetical protein BASA81_008849 [Batrachochytrium salamandrivorans]